MKNLNDVLPEDYEPQKKDSAEDEENRRLSKRWKLVALSRTNYKQMLDYIIENKHYFITQPYTQRDREEMRRTCQGAYNKNLWAGSDNDCALFNECFGPLKEAKPRWDDVAPIKDTYVWDNPDTMPFTKQVMWYADSSYYNWWNYIHSHRFLTGWCNNGIDRNIFKDIVEDVILKNNIFFKGQKQFEESDREYYEELQRMVEND